MPYGLDIDGFQSELIVVFEFILFYEGNLFNWWDADTLKEFTSRAKCFIDKVWKFYQILFEKETFKISKFPFVSPFSKL